MRESVSTNYTVLIPTLISYIDAVLDNIICWNSNSATGPAALDTCTETCNYYYSISNLLQTSNGLEVTKI